MRRRPSRRPRDRFVVFRHEPTSECAIVRLVLRRAALPLDVQAGVAQGLPLGCPAPGCGFFIFPLAPKVARLRSVTPLSRRRAKAIAG